MVCVCKCKLQAVASSMAWKQRGVMVWESAEIKDKPMVADRCFFFWQRINDGGIWFCFYFFFFFPKTLYKSIGILVILKIYQGFSCKSIKKMNLINFSKSSSGAATVHTYIFSLFLSEKILCCFSNVVR